MAESWSHRFGQILGDTVERAIEPILKNFADKYGLFLDKNGSRKARKSKRVTWRDKYGNSHDLDFVIEKGGTEDQIGIPVAFIESAWRRYTKHSKNKAQEIQGAILPLRETYDTECPFIGVILAGDYTENSIKQLCSLGFSCLYIEYPLIVGIFKKYGIDASSEENTPEPEFKRKVKAFEKLGDKLDNLEADIRESKKKEIEVFLSGMEKCILKKIQTIVIYPLYSGSFEFKTASEAIEFIKKHSPLKEVVFYKYEIIIKYSNGERIEAVCLDKNSAKDFLEKFL